MKTLLVLVGRNLNLLPSFPLKRARSLLFHTILLFFAAHRTNERAEWFNNRSTGSLLSLELAGGLNAPPQNMFVCSEEVEGQGLLRGASVCI